MNWPQNNISRCLADTGSSDGLEHKLQSFAPFTVEWEYKGITYLASLHEAVIPLRDPGSGKEHSSVLFIFTVELQASLMEVPDFQFLV